MEILKFLRSLWKRKWLIFSVTASSVILTFIFISLRSGIYVSTSQLATGITESQGVLLNENDADNNAFAIHNKFSNLIENITSQQVISLLSYNLILHDLDKPYSSFNKVDDDIRAKYSKPYLEQAKFIFQNKLDSIQMLSSINEDEKQLIQLLKDYHFDIESIKAHLSVERIPSTDYIRISYYSEDPLYSSFAVNTLSTEFIRYYTVVRGERTDYSVSFFTQLVEEKKADLERKMNDLREFKANNDVLDFTMQSQLIMEQIKELEVSEEEEQKKIIGLERALSSINKRLTSKELTYLEKRASNINERIYNLKQRISKLNEQAIIDPVNEKLTQELESLRQQLQLEIKNLTADGTLSETLDKQNLINNKINNETELEIAKARLELIRSRIYQLRRNTSNFASNEAQISAFEREITVAQNEYLTAADNLNSARLMSRNVGVSIQQVEKGFPSDEPVSKNRILTSGIVGATAFMLTIVFILFLEFFDLTLGSVENFKELTGLTCIGSLPFLPFLKDKYLNIPLLYSNINYPYLNQYKEQLKKIRFEVEASGHNTFLISSLKRDEGKTTTIIALAYALSLNSKKVLIIDCNLKNNNLTKMFSAKPMLERLSTYQLDGFDSLVSGTGYKSIDIIGCQGGNQSPHEIFTKNKIDELLTYFTSKYDFILIESGNLDNHVDSKELLLSVEKVIYVFHAQKALSVYNKSSLEYLQNHGSKLLGTILNNTILD